jgi:hypothetical protein
MSEELVQNLKTDILTQVRAKSLNTKKRLNMTTLKGKIAGIDGSYRSTLLNALLAADESPANVPTEYKHAVSLLFGYNRSKYSQSKPTPGGRRKNKKTRKQQK